MDTVGSAAGETVVSTVGDSGAGLGDFLSRNDKVNKPAPASKESAAKP